MATSIKLKDDLKTRISKLSEQRKRSAHWIMREAILQYLDREEARESFTQEAEVSWSEFEPTGMHLTGEETRAWLRTWELMRRPKPRQAKPASTFQPLLWASLADPPTSYRLIETLSPN
jgi:predicted transcriptional regulator